MVRRVISLAFCLSVVSAALSQEQPREPKGIYATFLLDSVAKDAYTAAYPYGLLNNPGYPYPALTLPPTNDVLINFFTILLDRPSVSGLAPTMPWSLLSVANPGSNPHQPAPD